MLGELESQRAKIDSAVEVSVPCHVYYYLPGKSVTAGNSGILRGRDGTSWYSNLLANFTKLKLSGSVLREN